MSVCGLLLLWLSLLTVVLRWLTCQHLIPNSVDNGRFSLFLTWLPLQNRIPDIVDSFACAITKTVGTCPAWQAIGSARARSALLGRNGWGLDAPTVSLDGQQALAVARPSSWRCKDRHFFQVRQDCSVNFAVIVQNGGSAPAGVAFSPCTSPRSRSTSSLSLFLALHSPA